MKAIVLKETKVNKRGKNNRGQWRLTIYVNRDDELKAEALDTYEMVCSCGTWNPEKQDFDWPGDPRYYGPPKYIRKELRRLAEEYASEPKPGHSGGPAQQRSDQNERCYQLRGNDP
ncbi:hypothetical protein [Planifilum fimeticola]|nr:hypothetical protein [Planifilum fimeticola]